MCDDAGILHTQRVEYILFHPERELLPRHPGYDPREQEISRVAVGVLITGRKVQLPLLLNETEDEVIGNDVIEETPRYLDEGDPVSDTAHVMHEVITVTAIDPVEATVERTVYGDDPDAEPTVEVIENPLITQDNLERAEAQAVVDATPQEVKDAAQKPEEANQ